MTNYLQFLSPHFSQKKLTLLGCHCSWRSHKTSKLWRLIHNEITEFKPAFGRPQLKDNVFNAVFDFLVEHARVAANRVSLKHKVPFRHLNDSVSQLYALYESQHPVPSAVRLCASKFVEYTKRMQIFIDPSRDSDMCAHCQRFRYLRGRITSLNRCHEQQSKAGNDPDNVQRGTDSVANHNAPSNHNRPSSGDAASSSSASDKGSGGASGGVLIGPVLPMDVQAPMPVRMPSMLPPRRASAEDSDDDEGSGDNDDDVIEGMPTNGGPASEVAKDVEAVQQHNDTDDALSSDFESPQIQSLPPMPQTQPGRSRTHSVDDEKYNTSNQSNSGNGDDVDDEDSDIDLQPLRSTVNKAKHSGPPPHAVKPAPKEKQKYLYIPRGPNITDDDAEKIAKIQLFDTFALKQFVCHDSSLSKEQKTLWMSFLDEYAVLSEHRHYAKKVNDLYVKQVSKTPAGHLIFTMDFKRLVSMYRDL